MAVATVSIAVRQPAAGRTALTGLSLGVVVRRLSEPRLFSGRNAPLSCKLCGAAAVLSDFSANVRKVRSFRPRQVKKSLGKSPQELPANEKLDKKGHLRTPRAAREIALGILYAAYVSGVHPSQVFEERLNQRLAVRGSFDKTLLLSFSHSPADFLDNEPAEDEEEFAALERQQEEEADREADILSAPIQIICNKFVLDFARRLVKAAADQWQPRELILSEILPVMWKTNIGAVALPVCILHLAIGEIESLSASPKVVVNEAVELSKRYCDGVAPRVVNGCLGTYIKKRQIKDIQSRVESVDERLTVAPERVHVEELGWNSDYRD